MLNLSRKKSFYCVLINGKYGFGMYVKESKRKLFVVFLGKGKND
jgi:hypothetical protein